MKFLIAICAGAMMVAGSATAQQSSVISNPHGIVNNFDIENLKPLLTELGVTHEVREGPDGQSYIAASFDGQVTFNLIPTACLNAGVSNCVGLNMLGLFSGGQVNQQTIAAFNQRYGFVSAGSLAGGGAFITRYDIADYGIPRGNFASSLSNYLVLVQRLMSELDSGANTISQEGYLDDMSARMLNNVSLSDMSGQAQTYATVSELHQASFEQMPELIKRFVNDKEAPRNKIDNIIAK